MYRNLEAEMRRANVNKYQLANCIGKTYNTVLQKMSGKYPFTLDEAMKIHQEFFPQLEFTNLFEAEDDTKTDTEAGKGA